MEAMLVNDLGANLCFARKYQLFKNRRIIYIKSDLRGTGWSMLKDRWRNVERGTGSKTYLYLHLAQLLLSILSHCKGTNANEC